MMITVFSDASHCPNTKAGGWGAWAKRDGWDAGRTFGGVISPRVLNASEAEAWAIANTLGMLKIENALDGVRTIIVQSDSLRSLSLVRQLLGARVSDHADGAKIDMNRLNPSRLEKAAMDQLREVLTPREALIYVRHVRGHKPGGGRSWVNRTCDKIARDHMLKERERGI